MHPSSHLAAFSSQLTFEQLPAPVVDRIGLLFLDWLGSALAGTGATPVRALETLAREQGPITGDSQILGSRRWTSPLFAAMVNGASSHVVEQDDLHNSSVFHPATVVFPPALAVAQALDLSGRELVTAAAVGYETGIRVGEFLGRSHYRVFHTTGTAGTIGAAMATCRLLGLDPDQTLHALGSAGTQAAGLWEFLGDAADSKQLHTAKAGVDGIIAAWSARDGLTGASRILEGDKGMAAGMLGDGDPEQLTAGLMERWALMETSFKFHASCRHTHPAADAMLAIMMEHDPDPSAIVRIRARVYQAADDVLGAVTDPRTIHQAKFSMGMVLALIALRRSAGVEDFTDETIRDDRVRAVHDRVEMVVDPAIDADYPQKWTARVEVELADGRVLDHYIETPKGDPESMLSTVEAEDKFRRLCRFGGAVTEAESESLIEACRNLAAIPSCRQALSLKG